MSQELFFYKKSFELVKNFPLTAEVKLKVVAEMIRHNILGMVMVPGSGHLGASLSAADVLTVLYHKILKINPINPLEPNRDIFILSKGHAGPAVYAQLAAVGLMPEDDLFKFRQLGGPQGHVDVVTPGIEANTGSLGMGISKGKGRALAFKKSGLKNKVFVIVGDGELQEGQNWEALQSALNWQLGNLVVLIDRNKIQSDKLTEEILTMPDLASKLMAFGWQVETVDGHNISELMALFEKFNYQDNQPKAVILETIKGKGVSFMEHPQALKDEQGIYLWHNKIPSIEEFNQALQEIDSRIKDLLKEQKLPVDFWPVIPQTFSRQTVSWTNQSVVEGYSAGLVAELKKNDKIIVLDGDLAVDCGIRVIEEKFPENFLEVGIAEQDMVSLAGGLARQGYLPIVNSFAAFLTARAGEQIYNNQTEHNKIIYVGHLAGLIPATPGKSHQATRDIALMRSLPEMVIFEPANYQEAKLAIQFLIYQLKTASYLRMINCKGVKEIDLPKDYQITLGQGVVLQEGQAVALIAYGPIMLAQALEAAKLLAKENIKIKVINLPWLNKIDQPWLIEELKEISQIFTIDDHFIVGGLGEEISIISNSQPELKQKKITRFGLTTFPESGLVYETLKHFGLDGQSLAAKIKKVI